MSTTANKQKRVRSPNKIKPSRATHGFWKFFLKPFTEAYNYSVNHSSEVEGYEAFFNVNKRRVTYCKARVAFKMPGRLWRTQSTPFVCIEGTGRRYVKRDEAFVLRIDVERPEQVEIEFDEQVFVLTPAQYDAISEYVRLIA